MAFDTSSPLIQAIINEGQTNGYSPIQIGAVASRALAENGGNTNGSPGDNGQSYGGMQWNNDRLDNLKSFAAQQGTSWDDPNTQAKFIYQELNGTEGKAGDALKAATDPTSAANAIMGYVRPAGYTPSNPQNGAGYGNTLAGTSAIAQAIANGSAGSDGSSAPPIQEGRSAGFSPAAAAGIPSSMGAGVPAGIQPSFGNDLQMAGAALMARDNPMGAYQLLAQAKQSQQAQLLASGYGQWEDKGTSPNGQQIMQVNKLTGQMRYLPLPDSATGLNAKAQMPTQKEQSMFEDNEKQMQNNANVIDAANTLRDQISSGKVNMKWDNQLGAYIANYTGNSTEESDAIKNAQAIINQQVGNIVASEKGVGTKTKLQQAMGQIVPAGGQYDPVTFLDALDRTVKMGRGIYQASANANSALLRNKPKIGADLSDADGNPMTPDAQRNAYQANLDRWDDANQDIQPQIDAFRTQHYAQSAGKGPQTFGSFLKGYSQ